MSPCVYFDLLVVVARLTFIYLYYKYLSERTTEWKPCSFVWCRSILQTFYFFEVFNFAIDKLLSIVYFLKLAYVGTCKQLE